MSKEEFLNEYQKIILKTNGDNDGYVIAICQASDLISRFANEKEQQISDLQSQLIEKDKEQNQKAIERLEEVKNIIKIKVKSIDERLDDLNIKIVCESTSERISTYEEIIQQIDQQINELKGGKEC